MRFLVLTFIMTFLLVGYQNCAPSHIVTDESSLNSNTYDSAEQFSCKNKNDVGLSNTKKLSTNQLINTYNQLFLISSSSKFQTAMTQIFNDGGPENFEAFNNSVDLSYLKSQLEVALTVADLVFESTTERVRVFGSCVNTTPNDACLTAYLNNFALKIFRRPLTLLEIDSAKNIFTKSETPLIGLKNVLAYHLQSRQFLFQWELGDADVDTPVYKITNYEIAARLAFALTDTAPNDELLSLAKNSDLSKKENVLSVAKKLIESDLGKKKVASLFKYWLHLEANPSVSGVPTDIATAADLSGFTVASFSEMDQFIKYLLYDKKAKYKEVMTSNASFAKHAKLAAVYEHAPLATAATSPTTSPHRRGLLNKVPFLLSPTPRTKLIDRAVKIRRYVLCETMVTPPIEVIDMRDDNPLSLSEIESMSNRQIIEHQTSPKACMFCHASINPTGSAFENFGPIGERRSEEKIFDDTNTLVNSVPVDSQGQIPLFENLNIDVADSSQLIERIAASNRGPACFVRHVYKYMKERSISEADDCQLDQMYKSHQSESGTILDVFVESIVNDALSLRRKE